VLGILDFLRQGVQNLFQDSSVVEIPRGKGIEFLTQSVIEAFIKQFDHLDLDWKRVSESHTGGRFRQNVYEQLLLTKIPNSQKRQLSNQCLFVLLGSLHAKATHKTCQVARSSIMQKFKNIFPTLNKKDVFGKKIPWHHFKLFIAIYSLHCASGFAHQKERIIGWILQRCQFHQHFASIFCMKANWAAFL
jgi:hypothetical protein